MTNALAHNQQVEGHQMYFGGSVTGKASIIGREISLSPPLFFLLCGMQVSLYRQLYKPIHARLLLEF